MMAIGAFGLAGGYGEGDVAGTLSEIEADWPAYVVAVRAAHVRARRAHSAAGARRLGRGAKCRKADAEAMASFWASMARTGFSRRPRRASRRRCS